MVQVREEPPDGPCFDPARRGVTGHGTQPPPDKPNEYVPTACPGGRAPHLWLPDGHSLYDLFGFEWTLLRLREHGGENMAPSPMLKILDLESEEARDLYGADFVLIRPDQIVAWRSNSDAGLELTIGKLCGFVPRASQSSHLA